MTKIGKINKLYIALDFKKKLIKLLKKIFKSDFAKNVSYVSVGTALAQFAGVLLSPVIAKLFSPEEFGSFMFFNSFIGVASMFGTLKYELSIPISRSKSELSNLLFLCFFFSILSSIILLIAITLFGDLIAPLIDWNSPTEYLLFFPIGLLLFSIHNSLIQWSFKRKHFKLNASTKISFSLGQYSSQILFGFINFTGVGLILGNIIGKSITVFLYIKKLFKSEENVLKYVSKTKTLWVAKRYIKFPYLILPSQVLSKIGQELPVFLLTFFFVGTEAVGQYSFANLIINAPILLIGTAIGDVFYSEASNTGREQPERLLKLSTKLLKKLLVLGLIPLIIFLFLSPFLFTTFFGEKWEDAGKLAQIISILGFVRLVLTPISRVFASFERHSLALGTNIFRVLIASLAFGISYYFEMDVFDTLKLYTVAMSVVYIITYLLARQVIKSQIASNQSV